MACRSCGMEYQYDEHSDMEACVYQLGRALNAALARIAALERLLDHTKLSHRTEK